MDEALAAFDVPLIPVRTTASWRRACTDHVNWSRFVALRVVVIALLAALGAEALMYYKPGTHTVMVVMVGFNVAAFALVIALVGNYAYWTKPKAVELAEQLFVSTTARLRADSELGAYLIEGGSCEFRVAVLRRLGGSPLAAVLYLAIPIFGGQDPWVVVVDCWFYRQ